MTASTTKKPHRFTATEPQDVPYAELLEHPRLFEFLHQKLRPHGLSGALAKDIFSQTLEALWRRRNDADPPDNLRRLLGLADTVLDGKLVDYFRRKALDDEIFVDAPRVPGDDRDPLQRPIRTKPEKQPNYVEEIAGAVRTITPEDRLEGREKLGFVQALAPKAGLTDDDLESMLAVDAGEMTIEEAAAARNMKGTALRVRLHRIRQTLGKAWAKHLAIRSTTVLMLLMLALMLLYTLALGGARRSEPPPPQRPQRTLTPQEPRGAVPVEGQLPAPVMHDKPSF